MIGTFIRWLFDIAPQPSRYAAPFHPRPDCPAVYRSWNGEMPPLDVDLRPVQFPCGAGLGCGGPGCRWARQSEYPLPSPPTAT